MKDHAVVLFDGVCNLCNASVNFIIDRDHRDYFRFAALQSDAGTRTLASHGATPLAAGQNPSSVILLEGNRVFGRSTAALRIARHLSGAWKLFYVLLLIPRPVRDLVYDLFAAKRYAWFGRSDQCRVPTPALRARFL